MRERAEVKLGAWAALYCSRYNTSKYFTCSITSHGKCASRTLSGFLLALRAMRGKANPAFPFKAKQIALRRAVASKGRDWPAARRLPLCQ